MKTAWNFENLTGKKYNKLTVTASLDRIDSNKGYNKENIQWVHKYINKMKMDFNQDYYIEMCRKVSNYENFNK